MVRWPGLMTCLIISIGISASYAGETERMAMPDSGPVAGPGNVRRSPQQIAALCARQAGTNLDAYAHCTQRQIVLPAPQQLLVECAMGTVDPWSFVNCAGSRSLANWLSRNHRTTVACANRSAGHIDDFAVCMGDPSIGQRLTPNERAELDCAQQSGADAEAFAACAGARIFGPRISKDQRAALVY